MKTNKLMMNGPAFAVPAPSGWSCRNRRCGKGTQSDWSGPDFEKAGKNDLSLFLSSCRLIGFYLSQQPPVQSVKAMFKRDRGRGFPGNFPGVYGMGRGGIEMNVADLNQDRKP
jgi:hypothetical protein